MNVGEWKDWCEMHERNANPQSPTPVAVDDAAREALRIAVHAERGIVLSNEEEARILRTVLEALHRPLADEGMGELVKQLDRDIERLNEEGCDGAPWSMLKARQAIQSLLSRCGEMEEAQRELLDAPVIEFLLGHGPLMGCHFGDDPPDGGRGRFWWRKHLRAALNLKPGGLSE